MKYLSQRNGYYWLRIKPSSKLLPYLPIDTKEYLHSLGKVSLAEAERKAHPILAKWLKEIALAKELASNTQISTEESIHAVLTHDIPSEELIAQAEQWRDQAYGDPYNKQPSLEFTVRDEMIRGTGKIVLPCFYLAEYQESIKHLNPKTVSQRISRLKTQFLPNFEYLSADSLKTVKIQRWVDTYITKEKPPSYKTLKGYLLAAKDYIGWLRRKGYLQIEDTFDAVKLPAQKQLGTNVVRESFTDEDLKLILSNIKDTELETIILLAMYTGCRIEELANIKPEHIKKIKDRYVLTINKSKTEAGKRAIPVNKEIEKLLKARLQNEEYIFPKASSNTNGIRSDAYSKRFGRLKTKLGFGKEKVFHSIRKTVSTKLEQAGVAEGIAADILGHEKETISYGLYSSGSSLEDKMRAIDAIEYNLN